VNSQAMREQHTKELHEREEAAEDARRQLVKQLKDLEAEVEDERKTRAMAVSAKKKLETEYANLLASLDDIGKQKEEALKQLRKVQQAYQTLQHDAEEALSSKDELLANYREAEKRLRSLESERQQMLDDLTASERQRRTLLSERDELLEVARGAETSRNSLAEENKKLETRVHQLEEDLEEESAEKEDVRDRLKRLEAQLEASQVDLQNERAAAQKAESQRISLDRQNKELLAKLADLEQENSRKGRAQVAALEGRIASLEEQLEVESKERVKENRSSRKLERRLKELMLQVEDERRNADQLRQQADKVQAEKKKVKREQQDLEEELTQQKAQRRRLQRDYDDLVEAKETLDREVQSLRKQVQRDRVGGGRSRRHRDLAGGAADFSDSALDDQSSVATDQQVEGDGGRGDSQSVLNSRFAVVRSRAKSKCSATDSRVRSCTSMSGPFTVHRNLPAHGHSLASDRSITELHFEQVRSCRLLFMASSLATPPTPTHLSYGESHRGHSHEPWAPRPLRSGSRHRSRLRTKSQRWQATSARVRLAHGLVQSPRLENSPTPANRSRAALTRSASSARQSARLSTRQTDLANSKPPLAQSASARRPGGFGTAISLEAAPPADLNRRLNASTWAWRSIAGRQRQTYSRPIPTIFSLLGLIVEILLILGRHLVANAAEIGGIKEQQSRIDAANLKVERLEGVLGAEGAADRSQQCRIVKSRLRTAKPALQMHQQIVGTPVKSRSSRRSSDSKPPKSGDSESEHHSRWFCLSSVRPRNTSMPRMADSLALIGRFPIGTCEIRAVLKCDKAVLKCDEAVLKCDKAVLKCDEAVLKCDKALLKCDEAVFKYDEAVLKCDKAVLKCDKAVLKCDKAVLKCDEAVFKYDKAVLKCDKAVLKCDKAVLKCDKAVLKCDKAVLKCHDEAVLKCDEAVLKCDKAVLKCDKAVLKCDKALLKCDEAVFKYDKAVLKCDKAVLKCDKAVLKCHDEAVLKCDKAVLKCDEAVLKCDKAVLKCDEAVLKCDKALLKCDEAVFKYDEAVVKCDKAVLKCDKAVLKCDKAVLKCDEAVFKYDKAVLKCDKAVLKCDKAVLKCDKAVLKCDKAVLKCHDEAVLKCDEAVLKCDKAVLKCHDEAVLKCDEAVLKCDKAVLKCDKAVLKCHDEAVLKCDKAVFKCDKAVLKCHDEAVLKCDKAVLKCDEAVLKCDKALLKCDEAVFKYDEAVLKCDKAVLKCDKAVLKCDEAVLKCDKALLKCDEAVFKYDEAVLKCDKAVLKCDKAVLKCDEAELKYVLLGRIWLMPAVKQQLVKRRDWHQRIVLQAVKSSSQFRQWSRRIDCHDKETNLHIEAKRLGRHESIDQLITQRLSHGSLAPAPLSRVASCQAGPIGGQTAARLSHDEHVTPRLVARREYRPDLQPAAMSRPLATRRRAQSLSTTHRQPRRSTARNQSEVLSSNTPRTSLVVRNSIARQSTANTPILTLGVGWTVGLGGQPLLLSRRRRGGSPRASNQGLSRSVTAELAAGPGVLDNALTTASSCSFVELIRTRLRDPVGPAASSTSTTSGVSLGLAEALLNISEILRCLNTSVFSNSFFLSQSGCGTRGTGLATCCRAAGMVMIFCTALLNLRRQKEKKLSTWKIANGTARSVTGAPSGRLEMTKRQARPASLTICSPRNSANLLAVLILIFEFVAAITECANRVDVKRVLALANGGRALLESAILSNSLSASLALMSEQMSAKFKQSDSGTPASVSTAWRIAVNYKGINLKGGKLQRNQSKAENYKGGKLQRWKTTKAKTTKAENYKGGKLQRRQTTKAANYKGGKLQRRQTTKVENYKGGKLQRRQTTKAANYKGGKLQRRQNYKGGKLPRNKRSKLKNESESKFFIIIHMNGRPTLIFVLIVASEPDSVLHVDAVHRGSGFNEWPIEKVAIVGDKNCRLALYHVIEEAFDSLSTRSSLGVISGTDEPRQQIRYQLPTKIFKSIDTR
uniref:Paramyosin n=1 Tax=Macrostomum lignano TaxID=282301 RepID=A0A1I8IEK4_9PLAT